MNGQHYHRHQIRRGLPKYTHRSESMTDMLCMIQMAPDRIVMGGHQDVIIDLDLTTFTETNVVSPIGMNQRGGNLGTQPVYMFKSLYA